MLFRSGKSTLIKTVMRLIPALEGRAVFGLHAEVGYFDQTLTQSFSTLTVMEDFHNHFPMLSDTEVRTALGAFLFCGDDVFKKICDLSGGEKVRLALCKIFKRRPNILILDEPTNHMDIIGKETLEKMLAEYTGTIITVSHDRYFINRICDRLIVFDDGGARVFEGTYAEYEAQKAQTENEDRTDGKTVVKKKGKPVSESAARNKKIHRIGVLESKMQVLTDKIDMLKTALCEDETVYTDYIKIAEIEKQIEELNCELAPFETEWLKLQEEIQE